ncbi:hypothetical protein [Rhizobium oryzicola]|uniref:Uncharacterized protein n=1 Tax=Rhizobium oryzicola TaxID=1232668 RepID=A0ABT8SPW1_9HYPH|nr:hypothetical protein [Rhizobium oryzicola]MDO1580543.1 hypothetical protein [Rhizobium oryzicola]
MLPPVAFASSASLSGHSQQHLLSAAIQADGSRTRSEYSANTGNGEAGSSSRLNLLSLSGQLQLAQGLSVVASTIGKLIRLDRREGESLSDYTERLSQAMASLTPEQRALLQKALNQILQGLSLRLLSEILRNPAGPDAAKVALQLELAAYAERDLAEQVVLTSYQENEGEISQPPNRQENAERPKQRIDLTPPRTGANNNTASTASTAVPVAAMTRAPATAPLATGTPNGQSRTSPASPPVARQDMAALQNTRSSAHQVADDGGIYHAFDIRSDWEAVPQSESPRSEARSPSDAPARGNEVTRGGHQPEAAKLEAHREQSYPAAANRLPADKASRLPTSSSQSSPHLNPATLYEAEGVILWLQDLVSETPSHVSDRARDFSGNATMANLQSDERATAATLAKSSTWNATSGEMPADVPAEKPAISPAQSLAATLAAAAMPGSVAGNTQPEATGVIPFPIPYPYPPRGDDFDEEEPLIKPVEATDEERSKGRRKGQPRGGNRQQPEQSEGSFDDVSEDGEAQDYYQRMSGWV